MKNWFIILILVCTIYNTNLFAQTDLENNLNQILNIPVVGAEDFRKDYLTGYMQPFVTAFGTAVGGAMYHRAYSGQSMIFQSHHQRLKIPESGGPGYHG